MITDGDQNEDQETLDFNLQKTLTLLMQMQMVLVMQILTRRKVFWSPTPMFTCGISKSRPRVHDREEH